MSEAQASIQAQGLDNTAMDYQQHFMASIAKPLDAAVKDGSAAAGKSSFDVIFVVTADGHIKDAFLTNPTKQSLGKYVSTKLVGVQAAKPPKDGWSVYVSMEHP